MGTAQATDAEHRIVQQQLTHSINAPLASSAGRLFDAVASLLGLCHHARYEGDAAMQLEACAGQGTGVVLPFPVREPTAQRSHEVPVMDPIPLLAALYERQARGVDVRQLAADFHESLVHGAAALASRLAEAHGVHTVVLGGGCFQNARLLTTMSRQLGSAGLTVLAARQLPANDGGVSYGQAAIAAARLAMQAESVAAGFAPASVGAGDDQRFDQRFDQRVDQRVAPACANGA
jgi:hydrogenase maturation protein HypF